jgi:hypothetical protein
VRRRLVGTKFPHDWENSCAVGGGGGRFDLIVEGGGGVPVQLCENSAARDSDIYFGTDCIVQVMVRFPVMPVARDSDGHYYPCICRSRVKERRPVSMVKRD